MNLMQKAFLHRLGTVLLVLGVVLTSQAVHAQGVHVTVRSNSNPSPGTDHYSDVVADGNFAYVSSWHNTNGVWIFDVSNPDAPKLLTKYTTGSTSANMQGIEVLNGIGYFGDDSGGGIHIVDLSNPAQPKLIMRITSAQGGYDSVHDLTLDGNGHMFVPNYRVNDDVQVWNVSNPLSPFLQMTLTGTDTSSVHDVTVKNNKLIMSGWAGEVDIWDITNLDTQAPRLLGSFFSGLHTQDVSMTDDGNFLACPRELSSNGDVGIFNISNPASVTRVATLTQPGLGISATSPSTSKIMGNLLFVAWYQDGLAIFDITDPTHPIFVGNYDTWPGPSFGGSGGGDGDWGVWPFLGLDRVLVSDRTTGLYVLDATGVSSQPAAFSLLFNPNSLVGSKSTTGSAYIVGVAPVGGTTLNMSSNNTAVNPSPVLIPAGTHSATFTQATSSVPSTTTVNVTASDGTYNAVGSLTLLPPQPSSVTVSPNPIRGGLSTTGKVTLNAPVAVNSTVALAVLSGGSAIASMPTSVVVPAAFATATWPIQTNQMTVSTKVKISATLNGGTKNFIFTVSPITPSSLAFSPTTFTGGGTTTGTVKFPAAVNQDTVVTLTVTSGVAAVNSIPANLTVFAGNSQASFTVVTNTVSASTKVTVSAASNGGSKSASFTVN
jgi:hypothetical protein